MRLVSKAPGSPSVRLSYCLNLHAASTIAEVHAALDAFTVPLRMRILGPESEERFGVGMYLEAPAARELRGDHNKLGALKDRLRRDRLDPFTFNAFPYGDFQKDGLKESVYAPDWTTEQRVRYTVDVAHVAAELQGDEAPRNLSISTHPGAYGRDIEDRSGLRACAENMARVVGELQRIEASTGHRVILSLESEPDASARNSRALAEYLVFAQLMGSRILQDEFQMPMEASADLMRRHLGTCLDCCHSAVEFESAPEALRLSRQVGPLGKIQFSSALRLKAPGSNGPARGALLDLDEPRFLHQVTARAKDGAFLHLADLPGLRAALDGAASSTWMDAEEWRCHFHVPVDLSGVEGLGTTRDHADEILAEALSAGDGSESPELHVEIETYTWDVLPKEVDAPADWLLAGLEEEYRHVLARCAEAGFRPPV